jgi:hypothetical protein
MSPFSRSSLIDLVTVLGVVPRNSAVDALLS